MKRKPKPNQVVVALTPVIFAPLAGAISVWAARHAGVNIDQSSLQAVFIAGATIALAKAGLWLKGWQEYEKRLPATDGGAPAAEEREGAVDEAAAAGDAAAVEDGLDVPEGDDDLDDLPGDDDELDGFLNDDLADDDEPVAAGVTG
jgi:hypothetical protein